MRLPYRRSGVTILAHILANTRKATVQNLVPGDCWLWDFAKDTSGYGRIAVQSNTKKGATHRLVYEGLVGPVPTGLDLDHLCRERSCCNPQHLEPVTRQENLLRGHAAKRNNPV